MHQIIYKYELSYGHTLVPNFPKDGKIIHFAIQHGMPTIWVLFPYGSVEFDSKTFMIAATGQQIDSTYNYVQSVLDGPFVWHLFSIS